MNDLDQAAKEWFATRDVVKQFIKELRPDLSEEHLNHNAAALIARLAGHNPPILTSFVEDE